MMVATIGYRRCRLLNRLGTWQAKNVAKNLRHSIIRFCDNPLPVWKSISYGEVSMKKVMLLMMFLCVFLSLGTADDTVLIIPREGAYGDLDFMLEQEVQVMARLLQEAGYKTMIASLSGKPFVGRRQTVPTDFSLAQVKAENYKGILLACMAVGTPGPVPPEAVKIVKDAAARSIPVAAQYGSVFILARAGLLEGKRYAFERSLLYDGYEGIYSGTGIVVDGLIATSGTCPYSARSTRRPDGTAELTKALISMMRK